MAYSVEEKYILGWNEFFQHLSLTSLHDDFVTKEQLRTLYKKEKVVSKTINKIAQQFSALKFVVENSNDDIIQNKLSYEANKLADFNASLHFELIIDMYITGNAFLVYINENKEWIRVLPENVLEKTETFYKITNDKKLFEIPYQDIIHFKMPAILEGGAFGDSPLSVSLLNILIDRYGYEFVATYFQKGGTTTGVIETSGLNDRSMNRLVASLASSFSSRRNMHRDKVLPENCKFVTTGTKFTDMQLIELLRTNQRDFSSIFGVPPVLYGDTDGANYANSEVQMALFYEQVILPLQGLYCKSIQNNLRMKRLLKEGDTLKIDNSNVKYLSSFNKTVEQIPNLKQVLTINEIRKLLGYSDIDETYFKQEEQQQSFFSLGGPQGKEKASQESLFESDEMTRLSLAELNTWIDMFLEKYGEYQEEEFYRYVLNNRQDIFTGSISRIMTNKAVKYYKQLMFKNKKKGFNDDLEIYLVERANLFLDGKIKEDASNNFKGYSSTFTKRIFNKIIEIMDTRPDISRNDIATTLRGEFFESYKNQMNTIVRTEIGHAISLTLQRTSDDISSYAKKASKTWNALTDKYTRDEHEHMNGETIIWEYQKTPMNLTEMTFSNGLRYPRDNRNSTPSDVINCRCTLDFEIIEFKEA